MSVTTLDSAVTGMLPIQPIFKGTVGYLSGGVSTNNNINFYSLYAQQGYPAAASAPSSGLSGAAITSRSGQVFFQNATGAAKSYLARLESTAIGTIILYDRLWDNSGISVTTTTAQTINSATWPARDNNGTTSGAGVLIGLECIGTNTGNGSPITNTTITYTGTINGASQTGSLIQSWPTSGPVGTFIPFSLAAGDTGVASVQSLTLGTSYVSGNVYLVAYRPIAMIGNPNNQNQAIDLLTSGMPVLYNNSSLFFLYQNLYSVSYQGFAGQIQFTQG